MERWLQRFFPIFFGVLMLLVALIAFFLVGCKPRKEGKVRTVSPTPSPVIATLQSSPTPVPIPEPTEAPTPPVKNVAAKAQPTPDVKAQVKSVVNALPSVQAKKWNEAKIKTSFEMTANLLAMRYERSHARYETVEKMRADGVPAPVLFALHCRESDNDFTAHPHEGSSLLHRTRYVPKGRLPPPKEPPYKWEVSAEDAYYVADRLQGDWSNLPWAFLSMERFNGMGYSKRGIPSPYLYSGTQFYTAGKFVSDGRFSSTFVDKQIGCIAILKRLQQRGVKIKFDP